MDEKCHKAQDIDLALFLLEPHGSEWQEFRTHYPHCAICSAEVQKWTSLELGLRTLGNVGTAGHPSAEALVAFSNNRPILHRKNGTKLRRICVRAPRVVKKSSCWARSIFHVYNNGPQRHSLSIPQT